MEAGSVFTGLLEKTELPKIMKSFLDVDPEITNFILRILRQARDQDSERGGSNKDYFASSIRWLTRIMSMMHIESTQGTGISEYWLPYMVAVGIIKIDGYEGELSDAILWSVLKGKAEHIYGINLGGPADEGMLSLLENELKSLVKRKLSSFPTEEYDSLIKELQSFKEYFSLRYEVDRDFPTENEAVLYFSQLKDKKSLTNAISKGELDRYIDEKGKKSVNHVTSSSAITWLTDGKRRNKLKYYPSLFYPEGSGLFKDDPWEFIGIPATNKSELEEFLTTHENKSVTS